MRMDQAQRRITSCPRAPPSTEPRPQEQARRGNRVERNRWPTSYGDWIGSQAPRERVSRRAREDGRRGVEAIGGRWRAGGVRYFLRRHPTQILTDHNVTYMAGSPLRTRRRRTRTAAIRPCDLVSLARPPRPPSRFRSTAGSPGCRFPPPVEKGYRKLLFLPTSPMSTSIFQHQRVPHYY